MQNATVVSRPGFPALSNGALVSLVSLILCTGKWRKLFTETGPAFNIGLKYRKNKCTIRKSGKSWSRNISKVLYSYVLHGFCL